MQNYTVIWRDNGDEFIITEFEADIEDDTNTSPDEWVTKAATQEAIVANYTQEQIDDEVSALLEQGYDLITVIRGKVDYVW